MSRTEKLAFALQAGSNRGKVITEKAKARINELVDQKRKCNEIFNIMKIEKDTEGNILWIGLKYQNVRSYLTTSFKKANKVEVEVNA